MKRSFWVPRRRKSRQADPPAAPPPSPFSLPLVSLSRRDIAALALVALLSAATAPTAVWDAAQGVAAVTEKRELTAILSARILLACPARMRRPSTTPRPTPSTTPRKSRSRRVARPSRSPRAGRDRRARWPRPRPRPRLCIECDSPRCPPPAGRTRRTRVTQCCNTARAHAATAGGRQRGGEPRGQE